MLWLVAACTGSAAPGEVGGAAVAETYGAWPAFLPIPTDHPDSVLTGTAGRPALTSEGDTVEVQLRGGSVQVTVAGPEVPGQGLPYQQPTTTCTWTVTLSGATAAVGVDPADFGALDHLGATYRPSLVPGGPQPPTMLNPGETASFQLRAVMTTGEGVISWAPDHVHVVASWDFVAEND